MTCVPPKTKAANVAGEGQGVGCVRLVESGTGKAQQRFGRTGQNAIGVRWGIFSRDGPGASQRRPSADRNSPVGCSLIRRDGLEGAVLVGGTMHILRGTSGCSGTHDLFQNRLG
jgi:hypothetical protein